jgi:hypothetical protein
LEDELFGNENNVAIVDGVKRVKINRKTFEQARNGKSIERGGYKSCSKQPRDMIWEGSYLIHLFEDERTSENRRIG